MKYFLALIFFLSFIHLGKTAPVFDFIRGFAIGLQLGNFSSKIRECKESVETSIRAINVLINGLKRDPTIFEKINMVTNAVWFIPDPFRSCTSIPEDVWKNFKEKFLEEFDYNLIKYLQAVFIGLGKNKDKILYNLNNLISEFKKHNYYKSGEYTGNLVNVILNVTKLKDVSTTKSYQFTESVLPSIDLDNFHKEFIKYFGYAITTLNYTKLVDMEHISKLNGSVLEIEMKIYLSSKDFNNKKILEGSLKLLDTLKFANDLFRGAYFSVVQVLQRGGDNLIFDHMEYFTTNLLLHSGYFLWDGWKLVEAIINNNMKEILRRSVIIARKILYLDDDAIIDMLSMIESIEE